MPKFSQNTKVKSDKDSASEARELYLAACSGDFEKVKDMLNKNFLLANSKILLKSKNGFSFDQKDIVTPILGVVTSQKINEEVRYKMVELLIKNGADPKISGSNNSAFSFTARQSYQGKLVPIQDSVTLNYNPIEALGKPDLTSNDPQIKWRNKTIFLINGQKKESKKIVVKTEDDQKKIIKKEKILEQEKSSTDQNLEGSTETNKSGLTIDTTEENDVFSIDTYDSDESVANRLLAKSATLSEFVGEEDLSTASTPKAASEVEFWNKSNISQNPSGFFARHPKVKDALVTSAYAATPVGLSGIAIGVMALTGYFQHGDWSRCLMSDGGLAAHAWQTALYIGIGLSVLYLFSKFIGALFEDAASNPVLDQTKSSSPTC